MQGLGNVLNVQFGTAMNYFNILFFVVILIVYRKGIHIGTVLYTFTLGTFCTILDPWIVAVIGPDPTLVTRIILVVTAPSPWALAWASTSPRSLAAGLPTPSTSSWPKTLKMQLRWWRMIFDAIMVVGALIMGGVVHVGTLVGMFLVGPVLGPVLNKMAPIVNKWSGNEDIVYEAK